MWLRDPQLQVGQNYLHVCNLNLNRRGGGPVTGRKMFKRRSDMVFMQDDASPHTACVCSNIAPDCLRKKECPPNF